MKNRSVQKKKTMSFRITSEQAMAIQKQAAKENMPVSELIREKALSETGFVSSKKQQEYFKERMMVAAEFQRVKDTLMQQGVKIDLTSLERIIYQSCL